jgi:hypothetical protein
LCSCAEIKQNKCYCRELKFWKSNIVLLKTWIQLFRFKQKKGKVFFFNTEKDTAPEKSFMSPFLVEKYNDVLGRIFIHRQSIWDFTFPKKLRLLVIVFQKNESFVFLSPPPQQKNIPQRVRHFLITNC